MLLISDWSRRCLCRCRLYCQWWWRCWADSIAIGAIPSRFRCAAAATTIRLLSSIVAPVWPNRPTSSSSSVRARAAPSGWLNIVLSPCAQLMVLNYYCRTLVFNISARGRRHCLQSWDLNGPIASRSLHRAALTTTTTSSSIRWRQRGTGLPIEHTCN